jgi:hypothetical protein
MRPGSVCSKIGGTVANVVGMAPDHTPARGLARDVEPEVTAEHDAPVRRRRGITGLMRTGGEPAGPPTWLALVAMLLVGSGGTATAQSMMSPAIDVERVATLEAGVALERAEDIERDREMSLQASKIAEIDARTNAAEIRMHRETVRSTRWMADVLTIHTVALGAIAKHLDVDVDLSIPPLLPAEDEP